MNEPDRERRRPDDVQLWMVRHESPNGPTCPSFHRTSRSTIVVVGKKITDPAIRSQAPIGDDEDAIEIPETLLPELPQVNPDA